MPRFLAMGMLGAAVLCPAQQVASAAAESAADAPESGPHGQLMLVLPFENRSKVPGIDWIGEAFPEILGQRFASAGFFVIGRDDRTYALDHLGLPTNFHPSRATAFRIAREMDADYVVLGAYGYDGANLSASAQVLDVKAMHLGPALDDSASLPQLLQVENDLAWKLLHRMYPENPLSQQTFLNASSTIRLDSFENYIRGVTATSQAERERRLREAVRISPGYALAWNQLGKALYQDRDFGGAAASFAHVPRNDASALEANFYEGLSQYYLGNFAKAEESFTFVAARLPLTEVLNNLGVVVARRGRNATSYFQRAASADPRDPDYRFNWALALYKAGDGAGAARQLKEYLQLKPGDAEAKTFLDSTVAQATSRTSGPPSGGASNANGSPSAVGGMHVPYERVKRNYDEASFRQLALEIQNVNEARMAGVPPEAHAAAHVQLGREYLQQGLPLEAEKEFRESLRLHPQSAEAHLGLATVRERSNDFAGARSEAQAALTLQPSAEAHMLLARLDLRDNNLAGAETHADEAARLEPRNPNALELQQLVQRRRAPSQITAR